MEVRGYQGAEEALNRPLVEAVAFAAQALLNTMARQLRSVGLHLVMPPLVGVLNQVSGKFGAQKRGRDRSATSMKAGRRAMR